MHILHRNLCNVYKTINISFTGSVLTAKDVVIVGVATHFVSSQRLSDLETELSKCASDAEVKATLNNFHEPVGKKLSFSSNLKHIDYCFSALTVEDIIRRLKSVDNEWSAETIKVFLFIIFIFLFSGTRGKSAMNANG